MTKQEVIQFLKENKVSLNYGIGSLPVSIGFQEHNDHLSEYIQKKMMEIIGGITLDEWRSPVPK
jgi:hypothetical protein